MTWQFVLIKKADPIHEADLVMTKKEIIKRKKEIKVRLTEAEHQALLERMEGGELATWIRNTCLDEKPNKKEIIKRQILNY